MLYSVSCDSLEIISLTCALNHSHVATTTQEIDSRRAWLLAFSLISTPNMHSCSSWPLWVLFGDPFDHLPFLDAEQEVFVNTSEPQPRLGDFDGLCCPSACNLDDELDDGLWETLGRSTPSIARPPLHGSLWIPNFCCWWGASACCSSSTAVGVGTQPLGGLGGLCYFLVLHAESLCCSRDLDGTMVEDFEIAAIQS